jgi:hypothetical protein
MINYVPSQTVHAWRITCNAAGKPGVNADTARLLRDHRRKSEATCKLGILYRYALMTQPVPCLVKTSRPPLSGQADRGRERFPAQTSRVLGA